MRLIFGLLLFLSTTLVAVDGRTATALKQDDQSDEGDEVICQDPTVLCARIWRPSG